MIRLQKRQQATTDTLDATYKRLHDNPDPRDIHTGDALNVVLTELVNPKVYTQVVQKSTQSIDSQLVKTINFEYAAKMILISLEDVSARGVPDVLATEPAFETDRQTIRALVAKGRKEAESENQVSIETLRSFRTAVKALQDKADAMFDQGTRQRDEVDNFLKALYGLSKMLERPAVEQFLKGLNRYPDDDHGSPDHVHAHLQPSLRPCEDPGAGGGLRPDLPDARRAPRPGPGQGPEPGDRPGPLAQPEGCDLVLLRHELQPAPAPTGPSPTAPGGTS